MRRGWRRRKVAFNYVSGPVVPGVNDEEDELTKIATFVRELGMDGLTLIHFIRWRSTSTDFSVWFTQARGSRR